MMGVWGRELIDRSGARSPRSTRRASWLSTTRADRGERGERGAILRREGLYSSHIIEWRKAAQAGAAAGLGPASKDRRDKEIAQLRARAEKAEAELARSRAALDLMGEAHALLETLSESAEPQPRSKR